MEYVSTQRLFTGDMLILSCFLTFRKSGKKQTKKSLKTLDIKPILVYLDCKTGKEENSLLEYKIDVLNALKENGYNTTRILQENLVGQASMQQIRKGTVVGIKTLEKLCALLDMQPGDIIRYVPDAKKIN